jgi:putative intracellular protease/amidase
MNEGFWKSDRLRRLTERTKAITACDPVDYDGVFFVGGFGTMWDFPFSRPLAEFTQLMHDNYEGLVGAVCHGPIALLNVKTSGGGYLVAGKEVTAFCNEEEKLASSFMVPYFPSHTYDAVLKDDKLKTCEDLLAARAAMYFKKEPWTAHVLQADRVFTGQNPASAGPLSQRMLQALEERKQKR